jgi:putative transposase
MPFLGRTWIPAFAHCCPEFSYVSSVHGRRIEDFDPKSVLPNMILRSAVPFRITAFGSIVEPLDCRQMNRIAERHGGNRGVGNGERAWRCDRHLKALVFAQLAGLKSLRDIEAALSACPKAHYHTGLRPVRRSTLHDALSARPADAFRDVAVALMPLVDRWLRQEGSALIRLIDASPVPLRGERFGWAEADARSRGLKMHVVYDPQAEHPVRFALSSPKRSDITEARAVELEAGATYVFDKGYLDYGWWKAIADAGAVFVTRLKRNVHRRELVEHASKGADILADRRLRIGHKQPRGGAENPLYETELREIVVAREGKEPLHLVTNDLHRSAEQIAALYKQRWQIELFFKWIKQNLGIKSFLGGSENAVKTQIYAALIAFLLLRLFHATFARSYKESAKTLLARIKVALLEPLDLTERTKPPPRPPQCRPASPQFALHLPRAA